MPFKTSESLDMVAMMQLEVRHDRFVVSSMGSLEAGAVELALRRPRCRTTTRRAGMCSAERAGRFPRHGIHVLRLGACVGGRQRRVRFAFGRSEPRSIRQPNAVRRRAPRAYLQSWTSSRARIRLVSAPVARSPLPSSPDATESQEAIPRRSKLGMRSWIGDVTRIDSAAQAFDASIVVVLRWRDPKLAHDGPGAKQFALDDIWHPGLVIANETGEASRSLPEAADVAPDGTAVYRQRIVGTFSQALNLRSFPFDEDTFRIQFVAPSHGPEAIRFVADERAVALGLEHGVQLGRTLTLQDWRVTTPTSNVQPFHPTPHLALAGFNVEFRAARQTHHFVIKVIIPLILIVAMSWSVFWIEPIDANTADGCGGHRDAHADCLPVCHRLRRAEAPLPHTSGRVCPDEFASGFPLAHRGVVVTRLANLDRTELARAIDKRCRWIFPALFTLGTFATLSGWVGGPGPA